MNTVLLVLIFSLVGLSLSATPEQWASRTIYQLLTDRFAMAQSNPPSCPNLSNYCGGTFNGITSKLDYIQGMGFDAIWISPVVVNYPGGYHGYWATDLYGINPNFSTEADLLKLTAACHSRGMYVMLDVVANHVGPVGYTYQSIVPFNDASHYHPGCDINDYQNPTELELCRLSGLPDLNQTNPYVSKTLFAWVKNITSFFGFDGLRFDTVPEVAGWSGSSLSTFMREFQQSAVVYGVGEVFDPRIDYVASYQGIIDGVLSYPMYFTLRNVFQGQNSMYSIESTVQQYASSFSNVSLLGTFIDNHDNPRFLNGQSDWKLYENALLYTLLSQGIPIIYYGTEQGFSGGDDPYDRETLWSSNYNTSTTLYKFISTVVNYRKQAQVWQYPQVQRYCDNQFYAFTRGNTFVALTNGGSKQPQITRTITYQPYANGTKLCNLFYASDCVTVQNGQFEVFLNNGECKVFFPVY
eukprot:TRINITY_DN4726_c0_g2_i1.p1 TRINITY_DN4726_c0_g2~~TRINITY_DN4726_c0_g2_i1.p1  ORF type:complete len:501 (-),score=70.94 TRINITY_DN4726_c0_g2_i1:63-1463(-)